MRSVKIEVTKLKQKISENREKHIKDFNEALAGFKQERIVCLKKAIKAAKADKEVDLHVLFEPAPFSYEKEYNKVIAMLNATVDEVVELQANEFAQFFMDEWHWKQDFLANSMKYSKSVV